METDGNLTTMAVPKLNVWRKKKKIKMKKKTTKWSISEIKLYTNLEICKIISGKKKIAKCIDVRDRWSTLLNAIDDSDTHRLIVQRHSNGTEFKDFLPPKFKY